MASSGGTQSNGTQTFEQQMAELEQVVERLERGDLTLEENVALYERGVLLSRACKQQVADAERRIQVLQEPELDGPVRVEDLALEVADEEMDEDEDEE
jgi:exodeoxyribonuclease VII small subunit